MRLLSIILGLSFILSAGVADAKGFFRKHDTNGDEVVTLEEFRQGKAFECDLEKKEKRFAKKDKNVDGQLSKGEFVKCGKKKPQCDLKKRQKRFAKKDKDEDNMLSKEEFMICATHMAQDRFDGFDLNNDGKITRQELRAMRRN